MSIPETATAMIIMNQGDKIKKLEQKLKQETLRRKEAEEVIEFYALLGCKLQGDNDYFVERDGFEYCRGGKRAREYKAKYKEEK